MFKVVLFLLSLCIAFQGLAQTQNAGLANQATVTAVCMISANNLHFGDYNPLNGTAVTANSNLYVTCVNGAAYNVYMSAGLHSGSDILNRKMQGAEHGKLLSYQLYGNASYSGLVWGDGSSGTDFQCGIGSGAQAQFTVYGKIFAGQNTVSVDSYSDVITVSVSY